MEDKINKELTYDRMSATWRERKMPHKLCPFCGGNNFTYAVYESKKHVECNECDCIGPNGGTYDSNNVGKDSNFSKAVAVWNEREFSETITKALMPCPFCGSDKLECSIYMSSGVVECNSCGTVGPTSNDEGNEGFEGAIKAWNRRDGR